MIRLTLPIPPSVNKWLTSNHRLTAETREYKEKVPWIAEAQMRENGWAMLTGKVKVTIRYYGSGMDWDNGNKALCDVLQGVVYKNDRQIKQASVVMLPLDKGGERRVEIEISKYQS